MDATCGSHMQGSTNNVFIALSACSFVAHAHPLRLSVAARSCHPSVLLPVSWQLSVLSSALQSPSAPLEFHSCSLVFSLPPPASPPFIRSSYVSRRVVSGGALTGKQLSLVKNYYICQVQLWEYRKINIPTLFVLLDLILAWRCGETESCRRHSRESPQLQTQAQIPKTHMLTTLQILAQTWRGWNREHVCILLLSLRLCICN